MKYYLGLFFIGTTFSVLASDTISQFQNASQAIDDIVKQISLPKIPDQIYDIEKFGAVANGSFDCKPAIDSAIQTCYINGGGKIIFSEGTYFCKGPIILESNIELHIKGGATILFGENPEDYLPLKLVRWEGVEIYNYSPYIYAHNKSNIAVTGEGKLVGNSKNGMGKWRSKQKKAQKKVRAFGKELVPVSERLFGTNHYLRPSFLQLMNCENILISGVTIEDVPFWIVHPTYCKNVTIRGITINSRRLNNDGIDIDSCEDVLVENCSLNTGDDAVAVKSGRDQDAWRVNIPSKNIIIRNCKAYNVLHGLAFGSDLSGGIENVYVQNFEMNNVRNMGVTFKTNHDRGGYLKNIFIEDVKIDKALSALYITSKYHSYSGGDAPTVFSNINVRNLTCNKARYKGILTKVADNSYTNNISLTNITIRKELFKSKTKD